DRPEGADRDGEHAQRRGRESSRVAGLPRAGGGRPCARPRALPQLSKVVQNAQRRASSGISLRHSGHFLIVGSGAGSRRARWMSAFAGTTTKKKTAAAIVTKVINAFRKSPYPHTQPLIL